MTASIRPSFEVGTSRESSNARLLRAIQLHGLASAREWLDTGFVGLSQAEAAAITGLSRPSVSTLAKGLRTANLLLDEADGLVLDPSAALACGVDIGFSQIRVAVSDLHGQVFRGQPEEQRVPLGDNADRSLDWMADTLNKLVDQARAEIGRPVPVVRVAISIAGPVDRETGKLKRSWGTGGDWQFLNPVRQLESRLNWKGTTFTVDRDANAAAVAEAIWGAARGPADVLYVKWSEGGVSAALIIQHHIFRGADGIAGEIGHAIVRTKEDSQDECLRKWFKRHGACSHCHRQGCLETVATLSNLCEYVGRDDLDVGDLLALARKRTERSSHSSPEYLAWHGMDTAARCLGRVLAPIIDAINPQLVVIGGKIGAEAYPMVTRALNESIKAGEVTPAIESLETSGGSQTLTNRTSVVGALALALLEGLPRLGEELTAVSADGGSNGSGGRED